MHFDAESDRLVLRDGDSVLAEYVFEPTDPQCESPRPFALLRTRAGAEVTAHRPEDHVWHKGLSLALPHVGGHNFWGGPTYVHGTGYVQLPNNGAQRHRAFTPSDTPVADAVAGVARMDEQLDWVAEDGALVLTEHRVLTARLLDDTTWALSWRSVLRNATPGPLAFGSPTSKGRADAGYAGIFWRGTDAFTGGAVLAPSGPVGDAARGQAGPWLAAIAADESAGVLMLAPTADEPWFARSAEYAGLCPAPFFYDETVLDPGGTLELTAVIVVGDRHVAEFAPSVGAGLVAELRTMPAPEPFPARPVTGVLA